MVLMGIRYTNNQIHPSQFGLNGTCSSILSFFKRYIFLVGFIESFSLITHHFLSESNYSKKCFCFIRICFGEVFFSLLELICSSFYSIDRLTTPLNSMLIDSPRKNKKNVKFCVSKENASSTFLNA